MVEDAPVWFAVQLHWSSQPIDLSRVRTLSVFRPYTLYATQSRRSGALRSFLRLGFFADPISARQLAAQVRSTYAASVVIPVLDAEVARAREQARGAAAIPCLAPLPGERQDTAQEDPFHAHEMPAPSRPRPKAPTRLEVERIAGRRVRPAPERRPAEEALDPLSESGVRHVRVEVQEEHSGRWKIIQLTDVPPDEAPFFA